ncbi:MAG TPA: hypothetical protein V6D47_20655 [Oscillatoriaceae cyanobacterium]
MPAPVESAFRKLLPDLTRPVKAVERTSVSRAADAIALSPEARAALADRAALSKLPTRPKLVAKPSNVNRVAAVRGKPSKRLKEMTLVERNHVLGFKREDTVLKRLQRALPNDWIYREQYLRDAKGQIVRDPMTGETRRIDFLVMSLDKVLDSIEVTGTKVDKTAQMAKEMRIRQAGGVYLRHPQTGKLLRVPARLQTRVVRIA